MCKRRLLVILVIVFGFVINVVYFIKFQVPDGSAGAVRTSDHALQQLLWRMQGPLSPTDETLLTVVRRNILIPPPPPSQSLKSDRKFRGEELGVNYVTRMFLHSVLKDLFSDEEPGFFVEAGALDGVILSNSLFLEQSLNWTGLLVEPDPRNFKMLEKNRRKAWLAPVCLSRNRYPETNILQQISRSTVSQDFNGNSRIMKGSPSTEEYSGFFSIQCLPAATLLTALNVTHVKYFSLDTEGGELDMIKSFPFDDIDVDVWSIEHVSPKWNVIGVKVSAVFEPLASLRRNTSVPAQLISDVEQVHKCVEDEDLVDFMLSKGYYFFDAFCYAIPDFIFVHINSTLFQKLQVPESMINRRSVCENKLMITYDFPPKIITVDVLRDSHHYPSIQFSDKVPQ